MAGEGNGQPVVYKVCLSENIKTFLKQLHHQYAESGQGKTFLALLRQLYRKLRHEPLTFGEPLYRLPALKLQIRHGSISPNVKTGRLSGVLCSRMVSSRESGPSALR